MPNIHTYNSCSDVDEDIPGKKNTYLGCGLLINIRWFVTIQLGTFITSLSLLLKNLKNNLNFSICNPQILQNGECKDECTGDSGKSINSFEVSISASNGRKCYGSMRICIFLENSSTVILLQWCIFLFPRIFVVWCKIILGEENKLLSTKVAIALVWLDQNSQTWSCSRE